MNREAEEFRISSDIKQANLELAVSLLRKAVDIKHHHAITDLTYPVRAEIEAFLASQQGEQVNFDIGRMEKAIAVPYHVIPAGLDADGLREWMSSLASQHHEQAEGAQGDADDLASPMRERLLSMGVDEETAESIAAELAICLIPKLMQREAALAKPSPSKSCTKPDCFPHCDCGSADDKAQPSPAPEVERPVDYGFCDGVCDD